MKPKKSALKILTEAVVVLGIVVLLVGSGLLLGSADDYFESNIAYGENRQVYYVFDVDDCSRFSENSSYMAGKYVCEASK